MNRILCTLWCCSLCFAVPALAQSRVDAAALVRALTPPLVTDLGTGHPAHGDERAGTPAWRVWEVQARSVVGLAQERALRNAVLRATGGRERSVRDTLWTLLRVEGIEVQGDTAVVHVDRGTRWCSRASGPGASGYTYDYSFRRAAGRWRYVAARPAFAYDPSPGPPPGQARPRCGV